MACYLFTYHSYGSWLPDHRRGYVHRGDGIRSPDVHMAQVYRSSMTQAAVLFDSAIQQQIVNGVIEASAHLEVRCHFIATEPTHIHVLVSWQSDRAWQAVRKQIRGSVTRRLNSTIRKQQWFSKSPSRKRVRDRRHFDYLVTKYLPKHSGVKWSEQRGCFT
jgi:REP element-mobilizing transposase RayT